MSSPDDDPVARSRVSDEPAPTLAVATRRTRFWLIPIAVVAALMSLLAVSYMGGILDPKKNLHDFPIALVNSDEGDVTSTGPANYGNQIADGLRSGIDPQKVELREMGIAEMQRQLSDGDIYGAIVIPFDFTKRLLILGEAAVVPGGDVERPEITVYTNPRAGSFGVSLTTVIADEALTAANTQVGTQLKNGVTRAAPDAPITGAAALTLAEPIDIIVTANNPLPDGTGLGLSAFYYSLLLLLAGVTGAMVVSALVDGALGFTPTEFGPYFRHRSTAQISRFRTLLAKWVLMVGVGVIVSALYLLIATALGMPSPHSLALWGYGALAITAAGITAVSIVSVFGTAGLLINIIFFIFLGLPSAGATVPLEATPSIYRWLSNIEPIHQVYLSVRSILYFDASADAGLLQGVAYTLIGLIIGAVVGAAVTLYYDRKGLTRAKSPLRA